MDKKNLHLLRKQVLKKLNQSESVIPVELYLHLYGYLNYKNYSSLDWLDIKVWVCGDVQRRVTQWLNDHCVEEPYTGQVTIFNQYYVLDILYSKKKVVVSKHELTIKDNEIIRVNNISIEESDYKPN